MAEILKGTLLSASKRYILHQALTSGYDSRVLLAASKDIKNQTKFFVFKVNPLTDKSADIIIPQKIANKHDISLEVVNIDNVDIDENFRSIFHKNNIFARETFIGIFYNTYKKKLDDTYWVTGTFGNEILRIAFPLKKKKITSFDIARRFNYSGYSYAVESIEAWLREAKVVYDHYGYDLINMFYWEQYTGNWENLGASEGAIVREEIHPFNCRKLITTYISLNDKYRYKDHPKGHLMIIRLLWKELLKISIGPYKNLLGNRIKRYFRKLGVELLINHIYNFFKNKYYYSS